MTIGQRDSKFLSDQTMKDKVGFDYSKGVIPYLSEEVNDFETEVSRFLKGEWESEADFARYRLIRGVYGQRQPNAQMHRIKIPFGGADRR